MKNSHLVLALLSAAPFLAFVSGESGAQQVLRGQAESANAAHVCELIANELPKNTVHSLGSDTFASGTAHKSTHSCNQSLNDISTVLRLIGQHRVPFAIQNGGHQFNPGFSSTTGVHISMKRFNSFRIIESAGMVEIGGGLTWTDVYTSLKGTGLGVNGGRIHGVGVSGLTLGGGYGWTTQARGLTIDSLRGAEVVLPSEEIVQTRNNFGIVTKLNLSTYEQGPVSGGFRIFDVGGEDNSTTLSDIADAISCFASTNKDTRAQPMLPFEVTGSGAPSSSALWFYDGPVTPTEAWSCFEGLTVMDSATRDDVEFSELIASTGKSYLSLESQFGPNGRFDQRPLPRLGHTRAAAAVSSGHSLDSMGFLFEPMLPTYVAHDKAGAFPHSEPVQPSGLIVSWSSASDDTYFHDRFREITTHLTEVGEQLGITSKDLPAYANYAHYETPVEKIYQENLPRLQLLKQKYDPAGVMNLAGGFKL
ncbi:hypothetical protein MNV49_000663 [Pseudohyphozyma bogoriensis]|nr:hypothetical protein MNV49_000663 [Pseudohyphozyma bogoriensis]